MENFHNFSFSNPDTEILKIFSTGDDNNQGPVSKDRGQSNKNNVQSVKASHWFNPPYRPIASSSQQNSADDEEIVQIMNRNPTAFATPTKFPKVSANSGFRQKNTALPSPILPPLGLQEQQKVQRQKMKEKEQFQKDFFRLHSGRNFISQSQNTVSCKEINCLCPK